MKMTFEQLLSPMAQDEFLEKYNNRKPMLIRGAADKFSQVLSWSEIHRLLNMDRIWTHRTMVLLLDGEAISPKEYCTVTIKDGGRVISRPQARLVRRFVQQGASLVLNDIDTLTPGMAAISQALQAGGLGEPWANAYISWKERRAFNVHADTHDVWVVQIEGRKTWNIWQGRSPWPTYQNDQRIPSRDEDPDKGELLHEWTLNPGDLLYLPWGWFHDALAASDASVHITYGVRPLNGLDLAEQLMDRMVNDPDFRQPMPVQDGSETARAALALHAARLGDKLAAMCRAGIVLDGLQGTLVGKHKTYGGFDLLRARGIQSTDRG